MKYRKTSLFLVTLLEITLLFSILLPVLGQDWPMFNQNVNLTGYTTSSASGTNETLWIYETGGELYSQPVINQSKLYILSGDGFFYCLNASTGALIWRTNMTQVLNYSARVTPRSTAAVVGGMVYCANFEPINAKVWCLNASDGTFIWNYTCVSNILGSPVVIDDKLYIADYGGRVYCLNATKECEYANRTIWNNTQTIGCMIMNTPAIADGRIYLGTYNQAPNPNKVFCLNATTGEHIWNYTAKNTIWNILVVDGKVYAGQSYLTAAEPGNVYCLDAITGAYLWNFSTKGTNRSPFSVHGDRLFFGSYDNNTYCLNKTTGALIWNYTTGGAIYQSVPAISGDGKVVIGTGPTDACLYCLNELTGALIWKYQTWPLGSFGIFGGPSIADSKVFVASTNFKVYALYPPSSPRSPYALFKESKTTAAINETIDFDASGSLKGWNGTDYVPIVSYTWNFSDGNVTTVNYTTISHKYKWYGTYRVNLTVTCQDPVLIALGLNNDSETATKSITPPYGPKALFTESKSTADINETINFDASSSLSGYNGSHSIPIRNYTWDFGDNTPIVIVTVPTISHNYTAYGTYTVNLTVTCYDDPMLISHNLTKNSKTATKIIAPTPPVPAEAPWPMYQHDPEHSGASPGPSPSTADILWTCDVGVAPEITVGGGPTGSPGGPAVVGNRVYVGRLDNKTYCLDELTGNVLWTFETRGPIYGSPAVVDGRVYFGSRDDNMYCVDADNGTLIWNYTVGGDIESSPTVIDGKVYFGSADRNVYCLDVNGTKIWNYTTFGSMAYTTPTVADGKVYFGVIYGNVPQNVTCLDAATGSLIWYFLTDGMIRASPLVADGKVYVATYYPSSSVYCLNATTGAQIWYNPDPEGSMFSICIGVGNVYTTNFGYNRVYALDTATGAISWTWQQATGFDVTNTIESDIVYADGRVYFGSYDNNVYCLYATNGTQIWSYAAGDHVHSPSIADGVVFVGSDDGKIYAFGALKKGWPTMGRDFTRKGYTNELAPTTNQTAWITQLPGGGAVWQGPTVVGDKLWVTTTAGILYCLDKFSGAQLWSKTFGVMLYTTPTYTDGKLYFGEVNASGTPANFYCINATTGDKIWNFTTGNQIYSSPVVAYGNVYFGSYDNKFYCLDAESGTHKWNFTTGGFIYSEPALAEGKIYFGSRADTKVWAINASTGEHIWNYTVDGQVRSGITYASGSEGRILVGTWTGTTPPGSLYCLFAANGTLSWSKTAIGDFRASPSVHGNKVIFSVMDGDLTCVDIADGSVIWTKGPYNGGYSKPAISGGKVYWGDDDSIVYCFNETNGNLIWFYNIVAATGTADDIDGGPAIADEWLFVGGYDVPKVYAFRTTYVPPPLVHDVAVISKITFSTKHGPAGNPYKPVTECYMTWAVEINVTVQNQGNYTETFTLKVFYGNATGNYTVGISPASYSVTLTAGASTSKIFTWDVQDLAKIACTQYWTYTIYANASVVPDETDTADNIRDGVIVKVKWHGDGSGDGKVGLPDLMILSMSYRKSPGDVGYNPQADYSGDGGQIALPDLMILSMNYRKGPCD